MKNPEYYQKPSSLETEKIIQSGTQMKVEQYATISGIKGEQFGRELFSAMLSFKDLATFLRVFPDVQRSANIRKISKIKAYVLSGVEDKTNLRFFNSITVTTRGHVFYNEKTKEIAIDISKSKLSINDGQHRFFGIQEAIVELEKRKVKAKNKDIYEYNNRLCEELKNMIIPVTIFNNISEEEEKQLFHDLNDLASKPSPSATIRLSQTDLFSKMAREIAESNHYLLKYGVECNKMSIHNNNKNTILLTTVYMFCKNLFYQELKNNPNFLTEQNYEVSKVFVEDKLNKMFKVLPQDLYVKNKYILAKGYAIRSIGQFIYEKLNDITVKEENIYKAIGNVNWLEDIAYWSSYGGMMSTSGNIQFSSHSKGAMSAIKVACENELMYISE